MLFCLFQFEDDVCEMHHILGVVSYIEHHCDKFAMEDVRATRVRSEHDVVVLSLGVVDTTDQRLYATVVLIHI